MAITIVQVKSGQAKDSSSSATTDSNVTSGNDLLIFASGQGNTDPGTPVAGDLAMSGTATYGTTEVAVATSHDGGEVFQAGAIYRVPVTGTGTCTATNNMFASGFRKDAICIVEVSDLSSSAAEATNSATDAAGTSTPSSGNATSAGAAIFIGGQHASGEGPPAYTVSANFTQQANETEATSGPDMASYTQTQIVTSGTTDASDATLDGTYLANLDVVAVFAEAASARTVNCTLATLTATEQASTVNATRKVDGTLATLTTTPNNATVLLGRDVAAALATLTATTNSATVKLNRDLAATSASLTVSPQVSTVTNAKTINASAASLTVTGAVASVNRQRLVAATSAGLALTPNAATVSFVLHRTISANLATITLSPFSVSGITGTFMDGVMTEDEWWHRRRIQWRKRNSKGWWRDL